MFAVCCLMPIARCLSCCLLFNAWCVSFVACCLLFDVCLLSEGVRWLLFAL